MLTDELEKEEVGQIVDKDDSIDEIEIEKVDYAGIAYNMALVLSAIADVDIMVFPKSEAEKIGKAKAQALKLMCFSMDELNKEHFPKKEKK